MHKITIAAADSSAEDIRRADMVCTGRNDEAVLNRAIRSLPRGGTLQLFDGNYQIDSFSEEDNTAILFDYNDGNARVITLTGTTENKTYNTHFGVTLHVTKAAMDAMDPQQEYHVFRGSARRPESKGDFFTMTRVNNVNFRNFYLYFYEASRKAVGIDCSMFGSCSMFLIGIYTEKYFNDRFMHLKPAIPCKGCIGVRSMPESNDEMAEIFMDTVNTGGVYLGFQFIGVDHLIMQTCSTARCCYGYEFFHNYKTMTMLNCCDEGNTHLPLFHGTGHLTCVDFNIERFNADFIPDDPEGTGSPYAVEETPGGWHGTLSYTLQGDAFGMHTFWEKGSGNNIRTTNLDHSRTARPDHPEFLETFFDRSTGKTWTWSGEKWLDAMGNPLQD